MVLMLDATAKKLLQIIEAGHPRDLRCAAVRVLGEIGAREPGVTQALRALLQDPEQEVRLYALEAVGKLRIEQLLSELLTRVSGGGPEAEVAAEAAARLGSRGTRALQGLMHQVAPGLRRRIAAALGVGGTSSAGAAAVEALLDTDPGVVDAAARSLIGEVPAMTAAARRSLADHVLALLRPKGKARLPGTSEAALTRLLAALGDPRGEEIFWTRIEPSHAAELRAAALQALGALPHSLGKDRIKSLLACAADADFRVAAPAMLLLKDAAVNERTIADWIALLDSPDPAARRFGIEKLGTRDTKAIAEALMRQVGHPDRNLHAAAVARLGDLKYGPEVFTSALLQSQNADHAWTLARAQAPFAARYSAAVRKRIFAQACKYLEENDRRAEPFFFLLREPDGRAVRDQLEERGLALRKKKDYAKAMIYLRFLARDPSCAESIRFELAACGIRLAEHDLAAESRSADVTLQQFARLVHSHELDPAERLQQARWLQPEDLFYLGFHFAEGDKLEREFGARALKLCVQRSPRSKLAKDAKRKLRSAGLS